MTIEIMHAKSFDFPAGGGRILTARDYGNAGVKIELSGDKGEVFSVLIEPVVVAAFCTWLSQATGKPGEETSTGRKSSIQGRALHRHGRHVGQGRPL